ncbi:sugar-binding domain-containing protein [Novosphingobium sp.]|uniref:glycoside hydrolase family 2 protein n=1 Tax=Novosphingobium sp. TaxID=1874826 RepID=UPI0035680532
MLQSARCGIAYRPIWQALCALALFNPVTTAQAQEARSVVMLDSDWRFFDGDAPDAIAPEYVDAAWQKVAVPHTWNRVGYYHHNLGGVNTAASVRKRQGIGWYRLHFAAPQDSQGKRQWLEFDAASRTAKVWLNGKYLGEHRGGFSRFRLDATAAMRTGDDNVLVVRVDNSQPKADGPTADVLPLTGDFFVHGGIYRPVRLVTTAPLHIDMADFGGPGIRATTLSASAEAATIDVAVRIANDGARAAKAMIKVSLVDRDGREAATATVPATLAVSAKAEVATKLAVSAPHLWHGTTDPYLYDLVIQVSDASGRLTDVLRQQYGIRTMTFDAAKGFLLNGAPYRLRGVGYHQDRDGKGWAISRADVEQDIATIREMGANTIRLTHYQHGHDVHDLANRAGILVWDEIPLVSMWTLGGKREADPALVANARQQLSELIRQNQNNAASAIWGLANEVDFGNSLPAFLTGGTDGKYIDPMPLLAQLRDLATKEDPSRPTALATCCEGRLFASDVEIPVTAPAADLGGANRYFGWYFGQPDELGPHLDVLRAKRPTQPLAVTEYGAGGALTIHTDNVLGAPADSRGASQPEEYESYIHETALAQLDARPWLYATWLWNSFDFATTIRTEGDAQDINTKGLVAYDHVTRKDAYYFYKANWNPAPMVHITGKRYSTRAYPVTDVKVYSNAASTELLLNGRSLGVKNDCPQKICIWSAVTLDEGANALVARGKHPGGEVSDHAAWDLPAYARSHMVIDTGTLVAGKSSNRVLGSDNWFKGGNAASLDTPANYGKPAVLAQIGGTQEREAMATYRQGTFSYRVPAADGRYRVKLWFATASTQKAGAFDVKIGKKTVLRSFRPAIPVSGAVTEAKIFTVKAKGTLAFDFVAGSGDARVSMIEIERVR